MVARCRSAHSTTAPRRILQIQGQAGLYIAFQARQKNIKEDLFQNKNKTVMSQACNLIISATLQGKEEDDKLKAWLGYRISSQPAWVTWHDPILGKRKESKEKEREN